MGDGKPPEFRAARMADTEYSERRAEHREDGEARGWDGLGWSRDADRLADADRLQPEQSSRGPGPSQTDRGRPLGQSSGFGDPLRLAHHSSARLEKRGGEPGDAGRQRAATVGDCSTGGMGNTDGQVNGFWYGADWVLTRPQRVGDPPSLRPVEPSAQRVADGTAGYMGRVRHPGFPLAQGEEARVLRLKGYGDAIVAPQAAAFVRACIEEWGMSDG